MLERVFRRTGPHFILVMMLVSRAFAVVAGCLCIYYVHLGIELSPAAFRHFVIAALSVIGLAVAVTTGMTLYETRHLRRLLVALRAGRAVPPALAQEGSREAVTFPASHAWNEALIDPLVTVVPICGVLAYLDGASVFVLLQVCFAGFLGLSCIIMATFFLSERWLHPVILYLLKSGIEIRYDELPKSRLGTRLTIGFGIVILVSTVMIGAVANQRAREIILHSESQAQTVTNLRNHTVLITLAALAVGVAYSQLLSRSVASRVNNLVGVMKRVQAGGLSERVQPTGNDEIDTLARQFNAMVEELDRKDRTVRDLNANLERKVRVRTRELARSKRNLQHSLEKLRESDRHKTEFFSNISHELRTPLMMILSPLEQIARREPQSCSEQARSLLGAAEVNAHRLLKLINQLLDFAKLESGHARLRPEAVSLNEFIGRLAESARPLAEQRGLNLALELDPAVGIITADEEKLDTIITNLVSNAIKFTPAGGRVTVRTAAAESELSAFDEPQVLIEVEDTGIGIDEQDLVRLFHRFSQIDGSPSREFAGTGLGLALVKELVELHEGRVDVASAPGRGSRFCVTLPARCAQPAGRGGTESPTPVIRGDRFADLLQCDALDAELGSEPGPAGAATVLVVDDLPEVRHMVGQVLREEYRVVYAADGESGWHAVLRERPDLIISDVMMPRVDGYEFCRRVKQRPESAAIPFVLLTAQAQLTLKIEGLNCGADDYLVKPFNSEELLARVRSLLRLREMHSDISDKNQRLERALGELQRTQHQLIQSEKMSSLGQLVAGLAHEINNSINAVYNGIPTMIERTERLQRLVDVALRDQDPDGSAVRRDVGAAFARIRTLASVVEEGANRTARIIGDMRKFSHPGVAAVERFNLSAALDVCVNLLDKQFRERVRVHRDYGLAGEVRGPASQLHQVFLNLLTNAVQAMPDGGEIFIRTRREGDRVVISIRDTGGGIPDDVQPRIFDPFFTTKPPGQGTGLGLSISYGIITRLGGTIECHSLVGIGTEFIIRLPADCVGRFADGARVQGAGAGFDVD